MSHTRTTKYLIAKLLLSLVVIDPFNNTAATEQEFQTIVVKPGDTLSKISGQYLEDPKRWKELLQYNNIANANLIRPGMQLKIPAFLGKKPAGIVVFRSGETLIAREQKKPAWQPLAVQDPIYKDNILKTAIKSNLHIQLDQNSVLKIYPESEVIFDPPDKKEPNRASVFLQRGRVNSSIVEGANRSYAIRTPAAVAAVRGTEFETEVNQERRTTLRCFAGVVEISAQKKTVSVPAGYGIMVEYGKPPGELFPLPGAPVILQDR